MRKLFAILALLSLDTLLLSQDTVIVVRHKVSGSSALQLIGTPVNGGNGGSTAYKDISYNGATASNGLVLYANASAGTDLTISHSAGTDASNTRAVQIAGTHSQGVSAIFVFCGISAGSHTVRTSTTTTAYVQVRLEEWQGLASDCSTIVDQTSAREASVANNTVTTLSVTTTQAKELAVAVASLNGAGNPWTISAPWTAGGYLDSTQWNYSEYQILSGTGSVNAAFTPTGTPWWTTAVVTLKGN